MELVSYTLSEENLNNDADPFLIGQADDVKKYLKICLHGNGSLESEFDLGDSLQSIEDIDEVLNGLGNVKQEFEEIKENLPAFKTFNEQIKNRKDLLTDTFALLYRDNPDDLTQSIPFQEALKSLNDEISVVSTNKERWGLDGEISKTCNSNTDSNLPESPTNELTLHPKYCKPLDRDWISSSGQNIKDSATIVSAIVDLVNKLSNTNDPFIEKKNNVETKYDEYLESYISMIDFLKTTIGSLIGDIKEITGDGKIFSFVNGKFIGINIEIILKYLKYSLGKDQELT